MAHSTVSFVSQESPYTHVDWSTLSETIRIVDMRHDKVLLRIDHENCQKLIDGLIEALEASKKEHKSL